MLLVEIDVRILVDEVVALESLSSSMTTSVMVIVAIVYLYSLLCLPSRNYVRGWDSKLENHAGTILHTFMVVGAYQVPRTL